MDIVVTIRKTEECQVVVRNVPNDVPLKKADALRAAMLARGKDWDVVELEADTISSVDSDSEDFPSVEYRPA